MDGRGGRLYRRLGRHYWLTLVVSAFLLATSIAAIFVYVATERYLAASSSEVLRSVAFTVVAILISTMAGLVVVLRRSRPVIEWIQGRRTAENATAAWQAGARMPSLHPIYESIAIAPAALASVVVVTRVTGIEAWATLPGFALGGIVAMGIGIVIHMVTTGAIMRPVLSEIDEMFPEASQRSDAPGSSLRARIVASALLVVSAGAWLAGGFVLRSSNPSVTLSVSIVTGIVVGGIFGLILTAALTQSIFDPLQMLRDAAGKVEHGDLKVRVPHVANDELGDLSESFNSMVRGLAERESLRSALGVYVEPGIADRLIAEGEILQGEEVEVTIMVVDIVGFSARAEMLSPDAVCASLNEFFELVVPVIAQHGGHTNKLLGDGLLAVFGAPMRADDHADRALDAACVIQGEMQARYRGTLRVGIGIHTGPVVVGTMGGGSKLDFTLVGDPVNVTFRVEEMTRKLGDGIVVTEATRDALQRPEAILAFLGTETIRGRSEPVSLYTVGSRVPG